MFLRRFFEPKLAQTSYLIGCVATGEALVIDPNRDADQYIQAAAAEGAKIKHVTETHIHADFLSGSRELGARTGATVYLSDEGDANWKYAFAGDRNVKLINEGDRITVGNIVVEVLHTPGHTPEHLTFLVTDTAGASEPIGAATGDFVFVGDVGRPDLLERAATMKGTMAAGAKSLYESLRAFSTRPDWLQIWPGHGAGSSCGKGISAIPQSTLGYEKRFNWAFQAKGEQDFVEHVLSGQPEPPKYFAEMKRINKEGPKILGGFPKPPRVEDARLGALVNGGAVVVDTRKASAYATGFVPGTINIPLNASFTTWAGWLVPYTADVYLIVDGGDTAAAAAAATAARDLAMIGLDRVAGYFDSTAIDAWPSTAGQALGTIPQINVSDLAASLQHGAVTLVDVRNDVEWGAGHIPGARHVTLGYVPDRLADIPRDKPVVLQCQSGGRSSIGASLLRARGFDRVVNLEGGMNAWLSAGFPAET
ncbi:MAG TPA: MBL fold metallo-hydrolase [Vicinamibacterales bacterium]|nr:MBL fold metallo-hydrolase [Vicinamibacterales bacterium]